MEEKIKSILSLYINVPAERIVHQTIIDRSAVESSILLHRMYAHLLKEKITIDSYWDVKTYEDLLMKVNGNTLPLTPGNSQTAATDQNKALYNTSSIVGIDVEEIDRLPKTDNYREEEFYVMNFSPSEIAYCILKPNPRASFTGLFAAKEAIIKADNIFASKPFNSIVIDHLPGGQPQFLSFHLSISHTNLTAIAVAIKNYPSFSDSSTSPILPSVLTQSKNNNPLFLLAIAAIVLSIIAIVISIMK